MARTNEEERFLFVLTHLMQTKLIKANAICNLGQDVRSLPLTSTPANGSRILKMGRIPP